MSENKKIQILVELEDQFLSVQAKITKARDEYLAAHEKDYEKAKTLPAAPQPAAAPQFSFTFHPQPAPAAQFPFTTQAPAPFAQFPVAPSWGTTNGAGDAMEECSLATGFKTVSSKMTDCHVLGDKKKHSTATGNNSGAPQVPSSTPSWAPLKKPKLFRVKRALKKKN